MSGTDEIRVGEAGKVVPGRARIDATLVVWVAGSLAAACIAAPPVYSALLATIAGFTIPYSRVFNRVALFVGIVSLWFLRGGFEPLLVAAT